MDVFLGLSVCGARVTHGKNDEEDYERRREHISARKDGHAGERWGGHWALIVAYMKERKLRSFDSMNGKHGGGHGNAPQTFRGRGEAEAKRLHVNFDRRNWSMGREMGIPQQGNCSDCGVFLCAFARHVVDATDFPFTQQDMDSIRARITYELVHGKEVVEGIKREMIQRTALEYSLAKYR